MFRDSQEIVLSSEDEYLKIQVSDDYVTTNPYSELLFNQEEGDTKLALHTSKILDDDPDVTVTICSPTGFFFFYSLFYVDTNFLFTNLQIVL